MTKKLKIEVTCKKCQFKWLKDKSDVKRWKSGLCIKCSSLKALESVPILIGENNPQWKPLIKCIDCNKEIKVRGKRNDTQTRCAECYHKSRNQSFCLGCNKKLLHSITKYCVKCFGESIRGEKNPGWKGGIAICKICNGKLSIYKNSNQYDTGICRKCYRGKNCNLWKFSISDEERENDIDRNKQPQYREWRKDVFIRDNYTCQKCTQWGGNLCSHHIENYRGNKEGRFNLNNGVTLCWDCHIEFHKEFGWTNNDVIQLMDFFDVKIELTA